MTGVKSNPRKNVEMRPNTKKLQLVWNLKKNRENHFLIISTTGVSVVWFKKAISAPSVATGHIACALICAYWHTVNPLSGRRP